MIGGRGAGKTRAGAEWVSGVALGRPPFAEKPTGPIALVGETEHDVREVMIEGVSGLLRHRARGERPTWTPSRRRLEWGNGVVAYAFSAEDPESLRGPQFAAAWCDELAKWRHAEATFDMLQFGLRLGERPRQVITTTPRPIALLKRLMKDPDDRGDACGNARQRVQPVAGVPQDRGGALCRHAARPPGDRRRDHRGPPRRAVVARDDRGLPRRGGAAARAHRGRGRSAGLVRQGRGRLRAGRRRARRGRHAST